MTTTLLKLTTHALRCSYLLVGVSFLGFIFLIRIQWSHVRELGSKKKSRILNNTVKQIFFNLILMLHRTSALTVVVKSVCNWTLHAPRPLIELATGGAHALWKYRFPQSCITSKGRSRSDAAAVRPAGLTWPVQFRISRLWRAAALPNILLIRNTWNVWIFVLIVFGVSLVVIRLGFL